MSVTDFDKEWQLGELLDAAALARMGPPLAELLEGDAAILDRDGSPLWGTLIPGARREALTLEIEPAGYLVSSSASPRHLQAAARLFMGLLRAEARYRAASALHLEAVTQDFETLKLEHARLLASEARYRKLSEELEERVAVQVTTLKQRQEQLYQAEKLASVGQLAAGMAHEINNPLGFVRSNLGTLRLYLDKFAALRPQLADAQTAWQTLDLDYVLEDSPDLLRDCDGGLERIARIVADLKSFSHVDRPEKALADLNTCLKHAVSVIEASLPPGVELITDLNPLPCQQCNPGHLNQVFYSLIRNGIQAIQDSGHPGKVTIRSCATPEDIRILLHDNGIGMTAEQLARAFEPFYTTRAVGNGTGLGLSTARNIILAHGGQITLKSLPGQGTTVYLRFPHGHD
ncbi:ATP-binding protein [Zoogloea sp.]|uniref:sensor histidine kinase n=1 Tax=Zoogloea sp. TaxID=49181 RepID=UPI00260FB39A|nr:ATP-binding protein [Zoogloea sp.]MDD3354130.1 ATP-binding protein [Zoogloea sp.]